MSLKYIVYIVLAGFSFSCNNASISFEETFNEFFLSQDIKGLSEGDTLIFKLKLKGSKGAHLDLVVCGLDPKNYYDHKKLSLDNLDDEGNVEWYQVLPFTLMDSTIKFYAWNRNRLELSYADFQYKIKKYKPTQVGEGIHLQYDASIVDSLIKRRKRAYSRGFISRSEKAYFNLEVNGQSAKAKLKGDWLDHLNGNKWSLRLKLQDSSWNGLRVFAVQNPVTRDFLHEWVYHKLLSHVGLLTTDYHFDSIWVNNVFKGVYAIEEQFGNDYVNRRNLNGMILKLYEDHLFEHLKVQWSSSKQFYPPVVQRAIVESYNQKDRLDSNFVAAQNIIQGFKFSNRKASEVFDLDQLAKYFSIVSLTGAYHGIIWHNQRFYFDHISRKLSPVAYDGGTPEAAKRWFDPHIFGNFDLENEPMKDNMLNYHFALFSDTAFTNLYCHYLMEYSQEQFIKTFIAGIKHEFERNTSLLRNEIDFRPYNFNRLRKHALGIQKEMPEFKEKLQSKAYWAYIDSAKYPLYEEAYGHPYPELLVNVFQSGADELVINNYLNQTIECNGQEIPSYLELENPPESIKIPAEHFQDSITILMDRKTYVLPVIRGYAPFE